MDSKPTSVRLTKTQRIIELDAQIAGLSRRLSRARITLLHGETELERLKRIRRDLVRSDE